MHKSLLLVAISFFSMASAQEIYFQDTFNRAEPGPGWKAASGSWKTGPDGLQITTTDYDQLLSSDCFVYGVAPFSIEVTLRGVRAGIFFNLDSRDSKTVSHMVRFDEKSILTGYMNAAGEYTATNTFDIDKMPSEWTVLRIDVEPQKKRYEVFVDGTSAGVDEHLLFGSGYIGLQASDGLSEFRSVTVSGRGENLVPARATKGTVATFQHVRYVHAIGPNLSIYNPVAGVLQELDQEGRLIHESFLKMEPELTLEVMAGEYKYAIDGKKVLVKNETGTIVDSITEHLVAPSCILTDYASVQKESPSLFIADPGSNAIHQFGLNGRYVKSFMATSIGGLIAPRGIDFHGTNEIVIADYNRLVFVNNDLEEQNPEVRPLTPTKVKITWPAVNTQEPSAQYSPDGKLWAGEEGSREGALNTVFLKNLTPLTRYSFKLTPALKVIPPGAGASKEFRFSTPPADSSMMALTRLRVMCMVYRTISYRDVYPRVRYPLIPDGRTMNDEELDSLRDACKFNTEFYFRNSACKIVLDFDFFVVQDTLWLHDVGDKDPYWLSCNERVTRDYEKAAQHFGRKPTDYDGLVCPYAWVNYPPRRTSALRDPSKSDSINIRQAYGGGTNGVPAPWKYGKTTGYTGNPFQDRFSRQDWLITHEFHHQIDALMDVSGYPEYYHADQPWKMPGRFGEDFDFNAHIIRHAGLDWWLNLKFGTLAETKDFDHDGVPDDDPSLPFDEKRLGGDPTRKDTDGDGLNDLQEVMAGTSRGTDLNKRDTDGDGLDDGIDPEPLYPCTGQIRRFPPSETAGDHYRSFFADVVQGHGPFCTTDDPAARGQITLRWDDDSLYIGARTPKPDNLLVQIDGLDDGWFHGFDNLQMRIRNTDSSARVLEFYLRDCSSWIDPPVDNKSTLDTSSVRVRYTRGESPPGTPWHLLVATIPMSVLRDIGVTPAKKFGLRLGLQQTDDRWVWNEMFERNYMMQVELK